MKEAFIEHTFNHASRVLLGEANAVISEYQQQGYNLTLRQLYYQLVSRAIIPNNNRSYKRLGTLISDGRLAGLVDWAAIVDRTRNLRTLGHWSNAQSILRSAEHSFHVDYWADQPAYVEVWIEKDALAGVIEGVCNTYDVPFFACRGYVSQSEMYEAAKRFDRHPAQDRLILHMGDHDPSGIDMTRDILARLDLMCLHPVRVERIALNWDQVEQYNPPPNPTKLADARAEGYIEAFGDSSWELDALDPTTLSGLIVTSLDPLIDQTAWYESEDYEMSTKRRLAEIREDWED